MWGSHKLANKQGSCSMKLHPLNCLITGQASWSLKRIPNIIEYLMTCRDSKTVKREKQGANDSIKQIIIQVPLYSSFFFRMYNERDIPGNLYTYCQFYTIILPRFPTFAIALSLQVKCSFIVDAILCSRCMLELKFHLSHSSKYVHAQLLHLQH